MKMLLGPDLHCFYPNYGHMLANGENSRFADWKNTAQALVDLAVSERVELALFPGDFFVNPRPSAAQVLAVAQLFQQLTEAGIEVVACPGNHDTGAQEVGPCHLVAATGPKDNHWCITDFTVIETTSGVKVAVLPWKKTADIKTYIGEEELRPEDWLAQQAESLRQQCGSGPAVLMGHWSISGAVSSSGYSMDAAEAVLSCAKLKAQDWTAVCFGHIHKPQVLSESPFIGYSGALERVDFGEEHDPRGCYVIDLKAGTHTWHNLPARPFRTLDITFTDPSGVSTFLDSLQLPGETCPNYQDSIVRVKVTADQGVELDVASLNQVLAVGGAYKIASVSQETKNQESMRDPELSETTMPLEALERWLKKVAEIEQDKADLVLKTAAELLSTL